MSITRGTRNARSIERRRCPKCERGSAIKTAHDGTRYCRWADVGKCSNSYDANRPGAAADA